MIKVKVERIEDGRYEATVEADGNAGALVGESVAAITAITTNVKEMGDEAYVAFLAGLASDKSWMHGADEEEILHKEIRHEKM